jgi:hypothetical protein
MAARMRTTVAVGLAVVLSLAAARAQARVRVAIAEFQTSGGDSPTLALQLQDGFVLGLVRAGASVTDAVDTARRLEKHPELQQCDTSACLKALGELLDVRYVVRVRVDVAGNSYKTVARAFSTEGATPGATPIALPISTKSKTCDVCTVAEARESLLRLAETLRPQLEEPAAPMPLPPAPPPRPPSVAVPIVAAMAGAIAVAAGFAVLASNGSCTGTLCAQNRTRSAVGGGLVGAGAVVTAMGIYVTVVRSHGGEPISGVALAFRW